MGYRNQQGLVVRKEWSQKTSLKETSALKALFSPRSRPHVCLEKVHSREGQGQTQLKGYPSWNKLDRTAVIGIVLEEETSQSSLSFIGPMN